jgi:hypothetical protein
MVCFCAALAYEKLRQRDLALKDYADEHAERLPTAQERAGEGHSCGLRMDVDSLMCARARGALSSMPS